MAFTPNIGPIQRGLKTKAAINTKPVDNTDNLGTRISSKTNRLDQTGNNVSKTRNRNKLKSTNIPPVYVTPALRQNGESSSSSSSDDFSKPTGRTIFYDSNKSGPVDFKYAIEPTVHTQQLEEPVTTSRVYVSKFIANLSRYHRPLISNSTDLIGYVNRQYVILFQQLSREVIKTVRSKVVDDWNVVNFYNAMQTAAEALSIFYALDSCYSYTGSDTQRDKNSVNIQIQRELETNSDLLYKKDDLRRMLKGVWFPPMFSELIRWTYQLYKTADLDQATNYRFYPHKDFIRIRSGEEYSVPDRLFIDIERILGQLNSPQSIKIWSILSQVRPEGEIVGLPLSCNTAVYDPRHYEIFCNQPVLFRKANSDNQVFPVSSDPNIGSSFVYGMNTQLDKASGLPFVLQSLYQDNSIATIDFFSAFRYVFDDGHIEPRREVNKFCSNTNGTYYPRTWTNDFCQNESADIHSVVVDYQTSEPTSEWSTIPSGCQPVYFDILTAPLINLRDFMSDMFGL
jgi:hypothetical protein